MKWAPPRAYHWEPVAAGRYIYKSVAAAVPNERHVPSDPTSFICTAIAWYFGAL